MAVIESTDTAPGSFDALDWSPDAIQPEKAGYIRSIFEAIRERESLIVKWGRPYQRGALHSEEVLPIQYSSPSKNGRPYVSYLPDLELFSPGFRYSSYLSGGSILDHFLDPDAISEMAAFVSDPNASLAQYNAFSAAHDAAISAVLASHSVVPPATARYASFLSLCEDVSVVDSMEDAYNAAASAYEGYFTECNRQGVDPDPAEVQRLYDAKQDAYADYSDAYDALLSVMPTFEEDFSDATALGDAQDRMIACYDALEAVNRQYADESRFSALIADREKYCPPSLTTISYSRQIGPHPISIRWDAAIRALCDGFSVYDTAISCGSAFNAHTRKVFHAWYQGLKLLRMSLPTLDGLTMTITPYIRSAEHHRSGGVWYYSYSTPAGMVSHSRETTAGERRHDHSAFFSDSVPIVNADWTRSGWLQSGQIRTFDLTGDCRTMESQDGFAAHFDYGVDPFVYSDGFGRTMYSAEVTFKNHCTHPKYIALFLNIENRYSETTSYHRRGISFHGENAPASYRCPLSIIRLQVPAADDNGPGLLSLSMTDLGLPPIADPVPFSPTRWTLQNDVYDLVFSVALDYLAASTIDNNLAFL